MNRERRRQLAQAGQIIAQALEMLQNIARADRLETLADDVENAHSTV